MSPVMTAMFMGLDQARQRLEAEGVRVRDGDEIIAAVLAVAGTLAAKIPHTTPYREALICALAADGANQAEAHALVAEVFGGQEAN
jgi:hypothetical protein